MIGRTGFFDDLLYSVGVSGFIYPIIGHWALSRRALPGPGSLPSHASTPLRSAPLDEELPATGMPAASEGALRRNARDDAIPLHAETALPGDCDHTLSIELICGRCCLFRWQPRSPTAREPEGKRGIHASVVARNALSPMDGTTAPTRPWPYMSLSITARPIATIG